MARTDNTNWNRDPPPGFQGLHPDKPLNVYQRHLPHWRQENATYFVTYRLSDSLPQGKLCELKALRREWESRHPQPRSPQVSEDLAREMMQRVERWLDLGLGSCHLRGPATTEIVAESMHYFDGERYELACYAVMPNHVHVIVRPLDGDSQPLERIIQSWKRHSAQRINSLLGRRGSLWQDESFDRIIRDEEHLHRCIQYIGRNPRTAGLPSGSRRRWIRPSWHQLGWQFEDT